MATLANQGVATQASFGQLGSAFSDGEAGEYIPPAGSVVVAITCLADTNFDVLTPETTGTCFGILAGSGVGTRGDLVAAANLFPQGITIYGRWTNVDIADNANGGIILYLGPSNSPNQTA